MKNFLKIVLVAGILVWSVTPKLNAEKPIDKNTSKPNILFILIDDFGWKDVGYNGSPFYETPEIDRLAEECMVFDNCYTPSPMCSPTRTSILTGKNPARHGITHWLPSRNNTDPKNKLEDFVREGDRFRVYCPIPISSGIKQSETTLGEAFQNAGYETAFYGKWHMGAFKKTGGPEQHGYASQKAVIQTNGCSMFYPFRNHPEYFPDAKEGDNFTDLLTDAAIDFVTAERDKPFYLHLCHFAMHHPIGSKPELRQKFEEKSRSLPELEVDRIIDEQIHKPQKIRQDDPEYAGELATLDENIGRLINALKSSGQYENTIIIFTGDNGGRTSYSRPHNTSNQPLRTGKTFLFEGGLRTPLLIHWPGHAGKGKRISTPVTSMDFYPTLLEMVGLPLNPQQHVDGVSLEPIFNGNEINRDAFYWHFPHYQQDGSYPSSAIRMGNYKLMFNYHFGTNLLFDVVNDPYEKNDLALQMPEKTKELHNKLMKYLDETGAYIPAGPIPFADRLEPCNRILNLMDEGWNVWGVAPIYGPEGKVHVFFARWRIEEEDWYEHEWTRSGQIVHAIAEKPEGPYKVLEVVTEGSGGDNWDNAGVINPQIHKIENKYVLIYTGTRNQGIRDQGIGMLIAPTLYGPWKRVSDTKALVETSGEKDSFDSFMCNNPALVKAPDGRYFMYYKGRSLKDYENGKGWRRIGLAIANRLEGPYIKYEGNPVLDHAPINYEDPYVWHEDGKFKMLMHDMTFFERGAGLYLESADGINWSEPVKGYPSTLEVFGVKQRLETPMLLMKNGRPEYLFNNRGASENEEIYSGFVWRIKE